MNWDFLQRVFWGNAIEVYLRFAVILILALLLKRYLTAFLTRLLFRVFRKFSIDYIKLFKELMLRPIEGLIVTNLLYVGVYQISTSLSNVILLRWTRPIKEDSKEALKPEIMITAMDLLNHIFFLFLLFYFILLISRILDFVFHVIIAKAKERDDRERQQILPLLRDVLKVVTWSFGVLAVLGVVFHVNVAALIAGLGVGGIAIAFAAKESLENLLASFMMMIDKPFTIGDWVKVNGVEGNIEKVGFRSTRIRSFDKSVISIPNRSLMDSNLENFSERGMRRVVFTVGAVYGLSKATLGLAMEEMRQLILNTQGVTGVPSVHLESFGASSVNIQVVYFILVNDSVDFGKVKEEVYFGIYEIMYKHAKGFAYNTQLSINGEDINEVFSSGQTPQKP